jgi:hypothetical protein
MSDSNKIQAAINKIDGVLDEDSKPSVQFWGLNPEPGIHELSITDN